MSDTPKLRPRLLVEYGVLKTEDTGDALGALRDMYADARRELSKTNPPCVVPVLLEYPDADPNGIEQLVAMHANGECNCGK